MKVLLLGAKGWIGSKYLALLKERNIDTVTTDIRCENNDIFTFMLNNDITHVLCCVGRTHGKSSDSVQTSTIEYLESDDTLDINLRDNLYVPARLALFCGKHNIHFTYIGTGCIYEYDDQHQEGSECGFSEMDKPNFKGSKYSLVRGYTDMLLSNMDILNLRIRMPISNDRNPRDFITKIVGYAKKGYKLINHLNSMSVLDILLPISIDMLNKKLTGTYNFVNPGCISHNEIMEMYRNIVDPKLVWENLTDDELSSTIITSKRSNNYLDTSKLEEIYMLPHIRDAVRSVLLSYSQPKVSVVIPTYEAHGTGDVLIAQVLSSIMKQDYDNIEVVVSDHSKTDIICKVVKHFIGHRYPIIYVPNSYGYGSISHNVNNAIDNSNGTYVKVLFMDDCLLYEHSISTMVKYFMDNQNRHWLACGYYHTHDFIKLYRQHKPSWLTGPYDMVLGKNTIGAPSAIMFKRTNCRFDPNVMHLMDCVFYHDMRERYGLPFFINEPLIMTLVHENQVTNKYITQQVMSEEDQYVRKKYNIQEKIPMMQALY